jgi:hypothetical protein
MGTYLRQLDRQYQPKGMRRPRQSGYQLLALNTTYARSVRDHWQPSLCRKEAGQPRGHFGFAAEYDLRQRPPSWAKLGSQKPRSSFFLDDFMLEFLCPISSLGLPMHKTCPYCWASSVS